ncbi:MAG TPA: 50S ribosomal protein L9 [Clostridia bacterium]
MKVILLKDVNAQGKAGDLIEVSDGYARNYLLKNKLAVEATPAKIQELKQKQEAEERKKALEKEHWSKVAAQINATEITLKVKSGENGKIFGSIQSANIADELKKLGLDIDKKKIVLPQPIKNTGTYFIEIKPYPEITAKLKVNVVEEK